MSFLTFMKRNIALAFLLICLMSCKDPVYDPNPVAAIKAQSVENYAVIVYASYEDSYKKALDLKTAAQSFLDAPSQSAFNAVKTAWLNARIPYEQTEAYRFYGGPIDDENGPEPLINSWPMDEAFIDYVEGNAASGIINDTVTYPSITKAVLVSLNTLTGETEVSCGYHAIEFLLWGQDFNDNGPGDRPYTDYVRGSGGTAHNQERRSAYLMACIDLLIDNLGAVADAWSPTNPGNYRAKFVASPDASLALILTGLGSFAKGELAGQRMTVAWTSHSQEEEHSCFSDNTDQDIVLGQEGIYNVYTGRYVRTDGTIIDGTGIDELIKAKDSALNDLMLNKLQAANAATKAIPHPFDQSIQDKPSGAQQKVLDAINAIKAEADELVEAAKTGLGITLIIS